MLECLQNALLFTLLFCSFPCFPAPCPLILALESGKKRVVVGVVVGNISCEWCPCLNCDPSTTVHTELYTHKAANPNHKSPIVRWRHPLVAVCGIRFVALPLSHVFCRCCILRSIFSWSPVTLFSQPTKKIITSAKWKCIYSLMWAWKRGSHAGNEKIRATLVFCFVLVFFFADFSFIWVVWNNNPLTFWCGSVPLSVTSRDQTNHLVHYRSLLFTLFTCQPLEIILDDKSRFAEMET